MIFEHCERSGAGSSIHVREVDADGAFHRRVIHPTDDVSNEADPIKTLASNLFTEEAKTEWARITDPEYQP